MDYLLKYVEIAAVPSLAASHVIEFLKTNFQWRHRMPKKVISDRSKTFRSRQLRSFLHRAEVGHHFASSYHPQANGLTERTNQTIQTRLAPYVETHKVEEADWDRHLQSAAYSAKRPSYLPREKPCANSFTGNFRKWTSRPVWTLPSKSPDLSIGRWCATISEQKHGGTLSMRRGPRRNTTIADIDAHRSMVSVTRYGCNEGLRQLARSSYLSLTDHLSSRSA